MGPRLFRRGNLHRPEKRFYLLMLQWGHVFSDVEIKQFDEKTAVKIIELQWGHVFSDVEIRGAPAPGHRRAGFNGATSFQTWK